MAQAALEGAVNQAMGAVGADLVRNLEDDANALRAHHEGALRHEAVQQQGAVRREGLAQVGRVFEALAQQTPSIMGTLSGQDKINENNRHAEAVRQQADLAADNAEMRANERLGYKVNAFGHVVDHAARTTQSLAEAGSKMHGTDAAMLKDVCKTGFEALAGLSDQQLAQRKELEVALHNAYLQAQDADPEIAGAAKARYKVLSKEREALGGLQDAASDRAEARLAASHGAVLGLARRAGSGYIRPAITASRPGDIPSLAGADAPGLLEDRRVVADEREVVDMTLMMRLLLVAGRALNQETRDEILRSVKDYESDHQREQALMVFAYSTHVLSGEEKTVIWERLRYDPFHTVKVAAALALSLHGERDEAIQNTIIDALQYESDDASGQRLVRMKACRVAECISEPGESLVRALQTCGHGPDAEVCEAAIQAFARLRVASVPAADRFAGRRPFQEAGERGLPVPAAGRGAAM